MVQQMWFFFFPFHQISQQDLVALQKTKQMVISSPIAFCGVSSSAGTSICHFSAKEFELSGEKNFLGYRIELQACGALIVLYNI